MKLPELNEWLTLIANIGVFAGLIFLAYEVQQNSDIARTAAYNDNINSFNEWRYEVVSDPELLQMMADYRGLDDANLLKKDMMVNAQWSIYEQAFYSYSYGLMGENEWNRFRGSACTNYRRVEDQDLAFEIRITADFWTYVSTSCDPGNPE